MDAVCSNCGVHNRIGAKFCAICGRPLSAGSPPSLPTGLASPSVTPVPLQPVLPQPPMPPRSVSLAPAAGAPLPRPGLFRPVTILQGKVIVIDPERQERAPFDLARALVMFSIVLLITALVLGFAAAGIVVGIALLILGAGLGVLGCLATLILLPLKMLLAPIINFIRGDPTVMVLNFQVLDSTTGVPVDVILCRKAGSGNVRLGDIVRVRGKMQRGNVVRAHEVDVYETGGHPTNYTILGLKPWPIWTGLIALGVTLGAILYFGVQIGLLN